MAYGILTLLPIVVVVVLALITKRTLEPLIVGSLIAYIITSGWGFPSAWMDSFFETAGNRDHQWVFMVCLLLFLFLFSAVVVFLGRRPFILWGM